MLTKIANQVQESFALCAYIKSVNTYILMAVGHV